MSHGMKDRRGVAQAGRDAAAACHRAGKMLLPAKLVEAFDFTGSGIDIDTTEGGVGSCSGHEPDIACDGDDESGAVVGEEILYREYPAFGAVE